MLRNSIPGFEQIMEKEEPKSSIILVIGTPGSFKSTFMFTALSTHTQKTQTKGIYITLEQSKERHLMNLQNIGFEKPSSVDVIDYNYTRKLASIKGQGNLEFEWVIDSMSKYHQQIGSRFSCVGIDSLNALYTLIDTVKDRSELYFFFEKLRSLEATTFIAAEIVKEKTIENLLLGSEQFLCDGIIELGTVEIENKVKRYIQVKKMRGVKHKMDKFSIDIRPGEGVAVLGELII
ncbi:MAG: hypothetical protein B6U97_04765 [Candidatus Altiarchaeales archaeon ex4484_96]|nr:MAG: hypothetical protein B6U97_04765 [Candidatus Altiarchaeales archaeon ex4484_96]